MSNLMDVDQPQTKVAPQVKLDPYFLRKVNILTSKDRPFCSFCGALSGFNWFTSQQSQQEDAAVNDVQQFSLCEACFKKGNYPKEMKATDFQQKSLSLEQWDRIQKDLSNENLQQAQSKPTHLSKEQQHKLLNLVLQHGDDWKSIQSEFNLKSKKEAILEFLRVKPDQQFGSKFLLQSENDPKFEKNLRDVEPYNQADQLFLQCELLQKFAESVEHPVIKEKTKQQKEKKRVLKEKRKLTQKIILQELNLMEEELKEMKTVDNSLNKIRHELKNLSSQLFAERVSMTIANKRLSS